MCYWDCHIPLLLCIQIVNELCEFDGKGMNGYERNTLRNFKETIMDDKSYSWMRTVRKILL